MPFVFRSVSVFALVLIFTHSTRAQCPAQWLPGEGQPGVTGDLPVWALAPWDPDGPGPEPEVLAVGGGFYGAGSVSSFGIALWDGFDWSPLGSGGGMNDQVMALTVFDGDLIAAGFFTVAGGVPANRVARWDGQAWHALGGGIGGQSVRALAVYNGELYAGGLFTQADGATANGIARWNGAAWQPVGGGVGGTTFGVFALTVFQGELIVGGGFTGAGGVLAKNFAAWNGTTWRSMDGGVVNVGSVAALTVHNGELIAGANFFSSTGQFQRSIARWTGTTWGPLGTGVNDTPSDAVNALISYAGPSRGSGDLYAGGIFISAGGVSTPNRLARWNGTSWSAIPSGPGTPGRAVRAFAVFNDELIVGGNSTRPSGVQMSAVGRWDTISWRYMGGSIDAIVYDFATYNGELIAGGWFSHAGGTVVDGIARRASSGQWHSMGGLSGGDRFVYDLAVYRGVLIASGSFTAIDGVPAPDSIAQWNGTSWRAFGNAPVGKKLVHDDELYANGFFGPDQEVARWNPDSEAWEPLGTFPQNAGVTCLTFFEGDLIAAGIGGTGVNESVWRWDFDAPGTWQPVGQHLGYNLIQTVGVFDGELLVGGYVDGYGGPPGGLARFDGTAWVQFGGGLYLGNESPDEILAVFDLRILNGDLYVAGTFSYAGSQQYTPGTVAAFHVARWDGAAWRALDGGTNNAVVTLHEHEGDLVVGGWFDMADGSPNGYWARWGPTFGDLDGSGDVEFSDAAPLIDCLTGPDSAFPGGCDCGDIDSDGDVDLADLGGFQSLFGP